MVHNPNAQIITAVHGGFSVHGSQDLNHTVSSGGPEENLLPSSFSLGELGFPSICCSMDVPTALLSSLHCSQLLAAAHFPYQLVPPIINPATAQSFLCFESLTASSSSSKRKLSGFKGPPVIRSGPLR